MFILCLPQPLKTGQTKPNCKLLFFCCFFLSNWFLCFYSLFSHFYLSIILSLYFLFLKMFLFSFHNFARFSDFLLEARGTHFHRYLHIFEVATIIFCCLWSKYISLDLLMTIANVGRMRCGECFIFLAASVIRGSSFQLFVHLQKHSDEPTTT